MAHKLYIENGKVSMMYVGEPPWHGLGTELNEPATAAEAIKAAGLDWEVDTKPIYAGEKWDRNLRVPDLFAVVRKDLWEKPNCPVFGIVGKYYTPLQNREAFDFFDSIVGEGAAIYHTAGALGKGERVWVLAKLPSYIQVIGDDITEKYLLLSNSHDGNSSVQIKFTPIRVVCNNTLTMALRQGPTLRVTHTKDIRQRLKDAEYNLGLIHKRFDGIEKSFKAMVRVNLNCGQLAEYLIRVFPDPSDSENERARNQARQDRIWAEYLYDQGKGNQVKGVSGTLWAAYNGIAEYVDYTRHKKQKPDRRLGPIWFGDGYLIKARAFNIAEELCKAWLK